MKNIIDILLEQGFEMDDEKAKTVEKAVLESYRTIEELNGKAAKLEAATARISELEAQAGELGKQLKALDSEKGASSEAIEALKAKVAEYEKADADRKAKEKDDAERAAFEELFAAALNGKTFSSELLADAVRDKSLAMHRENPAMGISDIIAKVTEGQDVWANPQREPKKMPVPGATGAKSSLGIETMEDIRRMSPKEINENWDAVKKVLASQERK